MASFKRSDFIWDKRNGHYICPNGKLLRTSDTVHDGRTLLYRASKRDCDVCPLRIKCCTRQEARKIPRDLHEDARDLARRKMKTKAFLKSRDQRKRVEMRFAHLKTHHGFERLRLRGLSGARDEFHLAAIVQNQKPWLSGSSGYHQNPRMRKLRCRDVSVVARATPPRSAEAKDPNPLGYFASTHQQSLAALTADFFDSIGHPETVRILGRR